MYEFSRTIIAEEYAYQAGLQTCFRNSPLVQSSKDKFSDSRKTGIMNLFHKEAVEVDIQDFT